jgi:hypothetical protein
MIVNVLKIKWLSASEIISASQCRFDTLWISYRPHESVLNVLNESNLLAKNTDQIVSYDSKNKIRSCLNTRGAYVLKLSHSADLVAIGCNQKYVERTTLFFMSPSNGSVFPVNLRNFGLNSEARGRYENLFH